MSSTINVTLRWALQYETAGGSLRWESLPPGGPCTCASPPYDRALWGDEAGFERPSGGK